MGLERKRKRRNRGFTLLEALLSLVMLGLMAMVVSSVYMTGLQAYDVQGRHILICSQLRGKMEFLLSTNFDDLTGGSENVSIQGESLVLAWTVTNEDMNADSVPDATAKRITLTLSGLTLTTLVADTSALIFKI